MSNIDHFDSILDCFIKAVNCDNNGSRSIGLKNIKEINIDSCIKYFGLINAENDYILFGKLAKMYLKALYNLENIESSNLLYFYDLKNTSELESVPSISYWMGMNAVNLGLYNDAHEIFKSILLGEDSFYIDLGYFALGFLEEKKNQEYENNEKIDSLYSLFLKSENVNHFPDAINLVGHYYYTKGQYENAYFTLIKAYHLNKSISINQEFEIGISAYFLKSYPEAFYFLGLDKQYIYSELTHSIDDYFIMLSHAGTENLDSTMFYAKKILQCDPENFPRRF